nr:proline-rich receptor-like protein kinase PERK1 [Lolium perenne]
MPLHHVCPSLLSSSPRKQTREDSPPPSASTSSSPAFPHLRPPIVVLRAPPGLPSSPPSPGARNRPGALEIDLNIAVPLLRLLQFTVEFAAVHLPPPSPTSPSSSRTSTPAPLRCLPDGGASSPRSAPKRRARRPAPRVRGASTSSARTTPRRGDHGQQNARGMSRKVRHVSCATSSSGPTRQSLRFAAPRICFFPDRNAKWCAEIRQVLRMFLGKL